MRFPQSLSLLVLTSLLTPYLSAQTFTKLNGELAQWSNGSVEDFALSPDGNWVAYVSYEEGDPDDLEIYSVPFDRSGPRVQLSATFQNEVDVRDLQVLADSDTVLFRCDESGVFEIYRAPIDGSSAPLSLTRGISCGFFTVHPDGQRLIYSSNSTLWVIPLDGSGTAMAIGDPGVFSGSLPSYFSPDGLRAVYSLNVGTHPAVYSSPLDTPNSWIDHTSNWVTGSILWAPHGMSGDGQYVLFKLSLPGSDNELFTSPMDGSLPPMPVNPPLDNVSEEVESFEVSPIGNRVVYRSNHQNFAKYQLYSVPADLSVAEQKISGPLPTGADVFDFLISPDGQRVVFEANSVTPGFVDLFVTGITGGAITQLNDPYNANGDTTNFECFPDSQWVLWRADGLVDNRQELYSARLDGTGGAVHLNASGPSAGFTVLDFLAGPNGKVLFRASSPDGTALYSVPRDGSSAPVRVSGPNGEGGGAWFGYQLSEDGGELLYRSDETFNAHYQLFGKEYDSPQPVHEVSELPVYVAGDVRSYEISPDSQWVVYEADQDSDNFFELYVVPVGGGTPVPIADLHAGGSYLGDWAISANSQWVVFEGNRDYPGRVYLYRTPIDGSSTPVRVNHLLPNSSNHEVYEWELSGPHVIYTAKELAAFGQNIYTRPLDLSGPEVRLNTEQVIGGGVKEFEVSPTGTGLVYLGDLVFGDREFLFGAPIDGSSSGVQLHPDPSGTGHVLDYSISPDGTRVAFSIDLLVDEEFHIYQAPLDGSSGALRVSHALASTDGDSYDPLFSADSTRVNYRAYEDASVDILLHSANLDGNGYVLLTPSMVAGGDVYSHASAAGNRVVYRADQDIDSHVDLYVVDDQGLSTALNLHPGLSIFADVDEYLLHPNGQQVLYLADDLIEGDNELFSTPLDGSVPPFRASGVMALAGDASLPHAFLHGRPVYSADQSINGKIEVFWRMIRNTANTPHLNAPIALDRDVLSSALSADQNYLVYLADQDLDGVNELYSRRIAPDPLAK